MTRIDSLVELCRADINDTCIDTGDLLRLIERLKDEVLALLNPDRPCIVDVSQIIAVSPDAADRFDILPSKELLRDEAHWLLVKALGEVVGTDLPKETKS